MTTSIFNGSAHPPADAGGTDHRVNAPVTREPSKRRHTVASRLVFLTICVAVAALGNDPAGADSTTAAACARQRRNAFIAGADSVAGSLCDSSGAGAGGLSANLFRRESDLY